MSNQGDILELVVEEVVAALRSGRSVLHQAALQGHEDVLRYLLGRISSSGSSSDLPPSSVQSPQLLQISKALSEAVLGAAKQGHSNCLSALLDSSIAVASMDALLSARNELGQTALIVAARHGRANCVKTLLQHNPEAQVPSTDQEGWTALMWAAWNGHAECVTHLLLHLPGAQVAAAEKSNTTALIFAASNGHAGCVGQLLRHNPEAQVAAVDSDGDTALITAVTYNHPDCVALLLAHSPAAQIAAVDDNGNTAVEIAARLGHPQCLDLLLAHDPQPQHLDAAWLAALRQWNAAAAHTSSHTQCLERLNAKGAMLPAAVSAQEADRAQNRLFMQDWGSRALVADRTNEAIVGLAVSVQSKDQKAG